MVSARAAAQADLRAIAPLTTVEVRDFSPMDLDRHRAPADRSIRVRLPAMAVVVLLHVVIGLVTLTHRTITVSKTPDGLVALTPQPLLVVSRDPVRRPLQILVPKEAMDLHDIPVPEIDPPVVAVFRVGTRPPSAVEGQVSRVEFARRAGLRTGEGATVVLRVEVLGTGDLGRIEIDVSSGKLQIDKAALAYVRAIKWNSGMVDGRPETMWIRWGVRLQA